EALIEGVDDVLGLDAIAAAGEALERGVFPGAVFLEEPQPRFGIPMRVNVDGLHFTYDGMQEDGDAYNNNAVLHAGDRDAGGGAGRVSGEAGQDHRALRTG